MNLRPLLPADAQATRISFRYEAWNQGGAPGEIPTVSTRVMECYSDAKRRRHHSWIFDFRWKPLVEGKGRVQLEVNLRNEDRHWLNATDKLVGPDIGVPAGWRLAVSDWQIEAIPASAVAPCEFPGAAQGFVTLARTCHRPSPLHLSW